MHDDRLDRVLLELVGRLGKGDVRIVVLEVPHLTSQLDRVSKDMA